jgi:hypothetical protein
MRDLGLPLCHRIFRWVLIVVGPMWLAMCRNENEPPTALPQEIGVVDQAASAYLTPVHLALLEQRAPATASAAGELANYYLLCKHDLAKAAFWKQRHAELLPTMKTRSTASTQFTSEQLMELAEGARRGDVNSARQIADYYWTEFASEIHALPWMQLASELGDVEASSYVLRLKVAIGVLDFKDVNQ